MDEASAARTLGGPTHIEIDGKTLTVQPHIARHHAEITQRILELRPDPIAVAKEAIAQGGMEPEMQKELLRVAMEQATRARIVLTSELSAWTQSIDGTIFLMWLQIRDNGEDYSLEWMTERYWARVDEVTSRLAGEEGDPDAAADSVKTEWQDKMNQASGEDWRGNSTGSPKQPSTGLSAKAKRRQKKNKRKEKRSGQR